MLKQLQLTHFTQFTQANFEFSKGLNLIIGENGLGKTHLLKLGYLACGLWHTEVKNKAAVSKSAVETKVAERLLNLFKAERLGNLSSAANKERTQVEAQLIGSIPTVSIKTPYEAAPMQDTLNWAFQFSNRAETNVTIDELPPRLTSNATYGRAVYLPSKEMLSFFEGFIALYQTHALAFEETFYDLAINLSLPALKECPELVTQLLADLSAAVGGTVVLDGGRFYIATGKKNREITLLAEGLRKLATIMQLLSNGSLATGDTLFWDEPEANLNPKLIKLVAFVMHTLSENGIQVIAATHSYFLLKELDLLSKSGQITPRYITLMLAGESLVIEQESQLNQLENIVALDEELSQYDREMELNYGGR